MEFQGETNALSEVQTKLLNQILVKHGFSDSEVCVETIGKKGDNYMASVKRIKAKKNNGDSIQFVVKIASTEELARLMTHTVLTFNNEATMYSEVLPKFVQLQESAGVPEKNRFRYPLFYGDIREPPNEFIVLEDLKAHNFEILNRLISLTNDEVRMTLKNIATFHSLSFVLQHKEPELFDKVKKQLKSIWANLGDSGVMAQMEANILSHLSTDEQKARANGALGDLNKTAVEFRKTDLESDYSVILQGDCWTNNIMFKMEEGKAVDCIMIDYQLSNASSPAVDILYFIFNCTDQETRSKNYFDWIDFYYEHLDHALSVFNLQAMSVYPREKLDADLKKYAKFCFGIALLMASVLMRDADETLELSLTEEEMKTKMSSEDFTGLNSLKEVSKNRLKGRVQELWDSFAEYRYI